MELRLAGGWEGLEVQNGLITNLELWQELDWLEGKDVTLYICLSSSNGPAQGFSQGI